MDTSVPQPEIVTPAFPLPATIAQSTAMEAIFAGSDVTLVNIAGAVCCGPGPLPTGFPKTGMPSDFALANSDSEATGSRLLTAIPAGFRAIAWPSAVRYVVAPPPPSMIFTFQPRAVAACSNPFSTPKSPALLDVSGMNTIVAPG